MLRTIILIIICVIIVGGLGAWSFWFGNAGSSEVEQSEQESDKERKG